MCALGTCKQIQVLEFFPWKPFPPIFALWCFGLTPQSFLEWILMESNAHSRLCRKNKRICLQVCLWRAEAARNNEGLWGWLCSSADSQWSTDWNMHLTSSTGRWQRWQHLLNTGNYHSTTEKTELEKSSSQMCSLYLKPFKTAQRGNQVSGDNKHPAPYVALASLHTFPLLNFTEVWISHQMH